MKDGRAGKPKNPSGGPGWHARKPDKEFSHLSPEVCQGLIIEARAITMKE